MNRRCPDCPAQLVATWRRGVLTTVAIEHHRTCVRTDPDQLPIANWQGTINPIEPDRLRSGTDGYRAHRSRTRTGETRTDPPPPRRRQ